MIKFCSLFSGSSGNSLFLKVNNTCILIDAGLSAKRIIEALDAIDEKACDIDAILISHEHSDHIKGAGIISRKFNIPIYANHRTWDAMQNDIGKISEYNRRFFESGDLFSINDICIKTFRIPHDAAEPVGFNFFCGNRKITVATDIGHINKNVLESIENSDAILLESNHDVEILKSGPYPWELKRRILGENGHLSNEMAGKVAAYLAAKGTKIFMLGHLSKVNNLPELAYQTVYDELTDNGIKIGTDVTLDVVLRDRVSRVLEM